MDETAKERRLGAARAALARATGAWEGVNEGALETGQGEESAEDGEAPARLPDDAPFGESRAGASEIRDAEARRRTWVRMTLIQDYRLSSAFIPVPKLAAILGLSPSTIWSHMRQGKFRIPYRIFNTTPMVCIDDLVDWYCARDDLILPDEAPAPRKSATEEAEEQSRRREAETDDIVTDALASLGIEPRRRSRRP